MPRIEWCHWGCGLALALSLHAQPALDSERGLPFIDTHPPREYGGHSQVWSIVEDAAGIFYFGNLNEVLTYDGARWDHIDIPDATFVRALVIDDNDTLWVGGTDELGYAKTDATGQRRFTSLKAQLPPEAREFGGIWRAAITPAGIIFQSSEWLMRWTGREFQVIPIPSQPRQILTLVGDEAWLTSTTAWQRVSPGESELQLEPFPHSPAPDQARAIASAPTERPDQHLIATDREGLWLWDGHELTPFPTTIDETLRTETIYYMERLADGRIVLNSLVSGVRILDAQGHLIHHLDDQSGLPNLTAISTHASHDGQSIWVGLADGIARIDARPWLTWFNATNGAPSTKLFTPLRFDDTLYIPAAASGLMRLDPAAAGSSAKLIPIPQINKMVNAATIVDRQLILSTTQGFFSWIPNGPLSPLPDTPSNASAFVPISSRPHTWAGLDGDAVFLYHFDGSDWHHQGKVPGIERARSLLEDSDGTWWTGRPSGGVIRSTFTHPDAAPETHLLTAPGSLPEGHGWTRFASDHSGIILGTEVGLYRWNPPSSTFQPAGEYHHSLTDGSLAIRAMYPDTEQGLWVMVSEQGMRSPSLRLGLAQSGQFKALQVPGFATIDDLSHLLIEPAVDPLRPETLWLGGQAALVRVNLDLWRQSPPLAPPTLQVSGVFSADGKRLNLGENWEFPAHHGTLRIQFGTPALAGNSHPIYESTLVTGDDRLVRTDRNPHREFDALGRGAYTLMTRARLAGGPWSNTVTLTFTVLPVWWLSPGAIITYVTFAFLIVLGAWELRIVHVKQRQRELERAVADRTRELATQNQELNRLRRIETDEKLAARLAAEKAHLQMLRYQLNPHFLFNTLNAICAQIIKSPLRARDTVIQLADFCRQTLHRPNHNQDPDIGTEVEMLRSYLEIEATRLDELFSYSVHCDNLLNSRKLPPFLLLPLVENAVKYGAATSPDAVKVRVSITSHPLETVIIEIANTGKWVEPRENNDDIASLGLGISNLKKRLTEYYPDRHEFVTLEKDGWVIARLTLDYQEDSTSSSSP